MQREGDAGPLAAYMKDPTPGVAMVFEAIRFDFEGEDKRKQMVVQVGTDGTVYVPHKSCGGTQGVMVSHTMGANWTFRPVPGTVPALSDPTIAIDQANRLYFMTSSGGHPVVAMSTNDAVSWTTSVNLNTAIGNTEFPMAIGGDPGRAAVAYYGTTTSGNDQSSGFNGAWHVYVAVTTDGGVTWVSTDVTGSDPVQRGCIWMGGGSNACRNLLDFQDMTVDAQGRILVGYADGCTSATCTGASGTPASSRDSLGAIARQIGGSRLFAAFGP